MENDTNLKASYLDTLKYFVKSKNELFAIVMNSNTFSICTKMNIYKMLVSLRSSKSHMNITTIIFAQNLKTLTLKSI
jgi:hypothetical protein